ncbi:MAG: radical SAM family heme chaperone HemW [Hyphomicrobiaceae bacterium]|nr:radical SAM family heme chaperone HemW [Hyphomicrobiaceae bacterium]
MNASGMIAAPDPSADPGFSVYVHWPFCAQKCPYCDFNSYVRHGGWDEQAFLAAYLTEIDHVATLTGPEPVASVFFGGGTPSLMQPRTVAAILERIAARWRLSDTAEITLEANPGSVEAERFAGYRAAGVNRVSLGVQALDDAALEALGRIHSVAEALRAVEIARRTFARTSFDLIYARPGQSPDAWSSELAQALSFEPAHLSLYQLTIEPGTTFERLYALGRLVIPDDEAAAGLFAVTQELTAAAGLPAYETSNHARPGEESRHNLVYWRYGTYAGIGPGAHGRLLGRDGKRIATVTERHPETWAAAVRAEGHAIVETEVITPAMAADELLLMGLRLAEGVSVPRLAAIGGVEPCRETVDDLVNLGVLARSEDGQRLIAVGEGRFILNEVVLRLSRSFRPLRPAAIAAPATSPDTLTTSS